MNGLTKVFDNGENRRKDGNDVEGNQPSFHTRTISPHTIEGIRVMIGNVIAPLLAVGAVILTGVMQQSVITAQTAPDVTSITQISDFLGLGIPVVTVLSLIAVVALWRSYQKMVDERISYLQHRIQQLEGVTKTDIDPGQKVAA